MANGGFWFITAAILMLLILWCLAAYIESDVYGKRGRRKKK